MSEKEPIPQNWITVTLGAITSICTGKLDVNAAKTDGQYPFFTCADETFRINEAAFDTEAVLLAGNGSFKAKYYTGKFNAYQRTYVIEPKAPLVDGKYLFHLIQHSIPRITANNRGSTIRYIRLGDIQDCELPLPPLNEQRRIVAKLKTLQERSQKAREHLEAVPPLLEKLRQSILASAFRGDLTKTWREQNKKVEPASELLKRIRKERRKKWEEAELAKMKAKGKAPSDDKWKGKYQEPEAVDATGLPELPEGWCWASLDQVSNLVTGGTPPGKEDGCYGGSVPFFKPTDLDAGRHVAQARQYLTTHGASFLEILPAGSVLVTCIGATIGKTGLSAVECITNQQINAAIAIGIAPEFLYWYIVGPVGQTWIVSNASATTLPILNKGRLATMPIAIAPVEEQKYLCTLLEILSQRWTDTASTAEVMIAQLSTLDRAILSKAFKGELVPQDPKDEPALQMLNRLQSSPPPTKKQRKTNKDGGKR